MTAIFATITLKHAPEATALCIVAPVFNRTFCLRCTLAIERLDSSDVVLLRVLY